MSIDDLKWVRVFSPIHIPKYLVEQIKHKEFEVEEFYKFQEINCLIQDEDKVKLNPFNHLYVLADDQNFVKGFVWLVIDSLTKDIILNTFSIDKKYWGSGKAVQKASQLVKDLLKKFKLNKVYWVTNYPKHSERYGFRRARGILMEYTGEKNGKNIDGEYTAQKKHPAVDSRATISTKQYANC